MTDDKFRGMGFGYDANGRMVKAVQSGLPEGLSVYDAAGLRVAERVNDMWRFLIYDVGGKLVAEYGGLQAMDEGGVKYVLQDWQGSTRAVVGNTGNIQSRSDYTAFGESIGSDTGLRTAEQGFGKSISLRQKYGLTERDDATGLDHTWFRKHENQAGRWTSPDPYNGSMSLSDPQSFNRYSYVENEPTNFVDPSGLYRPGVMQTPGWLLCYILGICGNPPPPTVGDPGGGGGGGVGLPDSECERFADRVAEIAAKHNDVKKFVDELAKVFIGVLSSDVDEMRANANRMSGERFGSSGFRSGLYDSLNDNQARHFMGGLIAGYNLGSTAGSVVMDHNEDSDADLALNAISISLGANLTNPSPARQEPVARSRDWVTYREVPAKPGFKGLADAIREQVCDK